jgi:hypothetical protein
MSVKNELHELIDQLDEEAAREALTLLQDLRLSRARRGAPIDTIVDLELVELPKQPVLEVQEPEG